jgi:hypothetical protein
MMVGILMDLALVLYLQVTRDAVQKASSFSMGLFPMIHVGMSLLAVVFFIPTVVIGIQMLKGGDVARLKPLHMKVAIPALTFRTLGFFFMFSLVE